MAQGPTDSGRGVEPASPEAIRAAMAVTRAALTDNLSTLAGRVFGPRRPTSSQTKGPTVAATKTASGTKKAAATRSAGAAKATKTGGTKGKATKTGGKAKAAPATVKKAAKTVARKAKDTTGKLVEGAKEVLKDVLSGAAAGALQGAAAAAEDHLDEAADGVKTLKDKAAKTSGRNGKK